MMDQQKQYVIFAAHWETGLDILVEATAYARTHALTHILLRRDPKIVQPHDLNKRIWVGIKPRWRQIFHFLIHFRGEIKKLGRKRRWMCERKVSLKMWFMLLIDGCMLLMRRYFNSKIILRNFQARSTCQRPSHILIPHNQSRLALSNHFTFCHIVIMDLMKLFPFFLHWAFGSMPDASRPPSQKTAAHDTSIHSSHKGSSKIFIQVSQYREWNLSRLRAHIYILHDIFSWKIDKKSW